MTFFTVLGRTFSSLILAWVRDKTNLPKGFIFRIIIFAFAIMSIIVPLPMWYYLSYLPYKDVTYPSLSEMNVDSGTWVFAHKRGEYSYLLTQDGKKILFNGNWKLSQYRDEQCKSVGLTSLSEYCPEIHAKVWWFPKIHSSANVMGQIEIDGKSLATYEDGREALIGQQDHSGFYTYLKTILSFIVIILVWEFLVQYITYRQEHNVRKRSE